MILMRGSAMKSGPSVANVVAPERMNASLTPSRRLVHLTRPQTPHNHNRRHHNHPLKPHNHLPSRATRLRRSSPSPCPNHTRIPFRALPCSRRIPSRSSLTPTRIRRMGIRGMRLGADIKQHKVRRRERMGGRSRVLILGFLPVNEGFILTCSATERSKCLQVRRSLCRYHMNPHA
jgi:hypothetical protein